MESYCYHLNGSFVEHKWRDRPVRETEQKLIDMLNEVSCLKKMNSVAIVSQDWICLLCCLTGYSEHGQSGSGAGQEPSPP